MSKFLYFADVHLTTKKPLRRIDNYFETVVNNLDAFLDKGTRGGAEYVLCGGDLFDSGHPSYLAIAAVMDLINKYNIPWIVLPGNHDLPGGWNTLNKTGLGVVGKHPLVTLLEGPDKLLYCSQDLDICVVGAAMQDIKTVSDFREYIKLAGMYVSDATTNILLVHWPVTEKEYPQVFGEHVAVDNLRDILAPSKFSIVLVSHWHKPFILELPCDLMVLNTGPLGRTSIAEAEIVPSAALIDTESRKACLGVITADDWENKFDTTTKELEDAANAEREMFVRSMNVFENISENEQRLFLDPIVLLRESASALNVVSNVLETAEVILKEANENG